MQRFLIFITVLGTLWLCACQKTEPEELRFQPSPSVPEAGTVPLQLSFGVVEQRIVDTDDPYDDTIPKTRVVNGRPDNVNLYIFNETAEYAYHAYLTKSSLPPTVAVPKGACRIYCIGNLGYDMGEQTPAQLTQFCFQAADPEKDFPPRHATLLSQKLEVTIDRQTTLDIELERIFVLLSVNIKLDKTLDSDARILHVVPYNIPAKNMLFAENRLGGSGEVVAYPINDKSGSSLRSYYTSFYLLENIQNPVPTITDYRDRTAVLSPRYAAYVVVRVEIGGNLFDYRIYLGNGDPSDFSIRRNNHYQYIITIFGTNSSDYRISKTQVTFWSGHDEERYRNTLAWKAGAACGKLQILTERFDTGNEIQVSYKKVSGTFKSQWQMQYKRSKDSEYKNWQPGEWITVHDGNGLSNTFLKFINSDGETRWQTVNNYFTFTLRDERGATYNYTVSTNPSDLT